MSFFTATQAAIAAGRQVIAPRFVVFDFDLDVGGPFRIWTGTGQIIIDALTWDGFGELASISDAEVGLADVAGNVTYTLSGVSPEVVEAAQSQQDKVRGRDVQQLGHFLDVDTLQPLDDFFVLRTDVMDLLSYRSSGPRDRTVSVSAETIWTSRNAAAFAYFSDRDQQARFAGDLGLERVAGMKNKRVDWPFDV